MVSGLSESINEGKEEFREENEHEDNRNTDQKDNHIEGMDKVAA